MAFIANNTNSEKFNCTLTKAGQIVVNLIGIALATGTVYSVEFCFALTVSIDQLLIVTANDVAFTGLRNKVEESSSWTGSANTVLLVIFSLANTFSIDKDFVSSTSPNTSLETGIVSVTVYGVASSANSVNDVSFG